MIIVSNEYVSSQFTDGHSLITYDALMEQVFSDEGFSEEGKVVVNINDVASQNGISAKDLFEALNEPENIFWFTTNREAPDFAAPIAEEIYDWYDESQEEPQLVQNETAKSSYMDSTKSQSNIQSNIADLMEESVYVDDNNDINTEENYAKIIVFGSSKGGTGKTFTSIMSTYRYAKTHPEKRVALVDFDLIDGQVGISIHKVKPTMRNYYNSYLKGIKDFQTMRNFCVEGNHKFPSNVDFYLAPSNGEVVKDDDFWFNVIDNLVENYDLVVFDTGIDYLNIKPIAYAYMSADKINLVTTTSIKSVTSVRKQISKLRGDTENNTYEKKDDLGPRLNVIITQMIPEDEMNTTVYQALKSQANVVATFGVITESVSRAEFFGEWDVFAKNDSINSVLDNIMSLE